MWKSAVFQWKWRGTWTVETGSGNHCRSCSSCHCAPQGSAFLPFGWQQDVDFNIPRCNMNPNGRNYIKTLCRACDQMPVPYSLLSDPASPLPTRPASPLYSQKPGRRRDAHLQPVITSDLRQIRPTRSMHCVPLSNSPRAHLSYTFVRCIVRAPQVTGWHTKPHQITSRHTTSYHSTSYHITSLDLT